MEKKDKFHQLKVIKKKQLTKNSFLLGFEIPAHLVKNYQFKAGQYIPIRFFHQNQILVNNYSICTAPYEELLEIGIKISHPKSTAQSIYNQTNIGEYIDIGLPKGRFVLPTKPDEFRTIVGFATGIGITPIIANFKNILWNEPRSRLFLFLGNKQYNDIPFFDELEKMKTIYGDRLEVHHFLSEEKLNNPLYNGFLNKTKLHLIINQILHLDDKDEETTLWDSVDEVLISGNGEFIKEIAKASFELGIPKKNIHFELFSEFEEEIFPVEVSLPILENIEVEYFYNGKKYKTILPNNKNKILQTLISQNKTVPFSCKSGICGTCIGMLVHGEVEQLENEYLTKSEQEMGKILPCMAYPLSSKIIINFDKG